MLERRSALEDLPMRAAAEHRARLRRAPPGASDLAGSKSARVVPLLQIETKKMVPSGFIDGRMPDVLVRSP